MPAITLPAGITGLRAAPSLSHSEVEADHPINSSTMARFLVVVAAILSLASAWQPSLDRRALLKAIPAVGAGLVASPLAASAGQNLGKSKDFDNNSQRKTDFGCSTVDDYFCKGGKLRNNAANSFTKGEVDVAKYKADIKMLRENGGVKMPDTTPVVKKA